MNKSKVTEYDYINFLIGTQKVYSCAEAERVCPHEKDGAAHDAYTRQLHRLVPTTERLWPEAREHIDLNKGVLIIDDSTLDKFYSKKIELAARHWSGKHKRVVSGVKYHRQSRWLEVLNRSKRPDNLSCLKAAAIQTGRAAQDAGLPAPEL